jgi:hypothetical protein
MYTLWHGYGDSVFKRLAASLLDPDLDPASDESGGVIRFFVARSLIWRLPQLFFALLGCLVFAALGGRRVARVRCTLFRPANS